MKRNKIVSLLMDMVPRKNRVGYVKGASMAGDLILCEIDDWSTVRNFLETHNVFGSIGEDNRDKNMIVLQDACLEYSPTGSWGYKILFKIRLHKNGNGFKTMLSRLATRSCRMYTIVEDGVPNKAWDTNSTSSTMTRELLIELCEELPILDCKCPDGLDPNVYTHREHGLFIE